jgi:polyisoprenoid-binding protein YceI
MSTLFRVLLFLITVPFLSFAEQRDPWVVDHANSSVGFTVNHMMISQIQGKFLDFFASVRLDENNLEMSSIRITLNVSSIDSGLDPRDQHLRSPDFLDVNRFPKILFESKSIQHISGTLYNLKGVLTIRNITKEVDMQLVHGGVIKDYWGNKRTGLKIIGAFNRFDFGLNWNELLEAGGLIVGEEIQLITSLEAFQQKGAFDLATEQP